MQSTSFTQVDIDMHYSDSIRTLFMQKAEVSKNDSLRLITIYSEYAENLNINEEQEAAIEQYKTALRIAQNTNNYKMVASVANNLANLYAVIGNFNASNEAYKTALENAEITKDNGEIAKISMNLASNFNFTGNYNKAIEYGLYALKIKETTNNLTRICYHYIAMGNIFRENNNTEKWEEYVQKAYKMKEEEGCASFVDITKIYNSLGGIAVQKEEFEKALLYYDTLMVLCKNEEYYQGISTALSNSAGVYLQQNQFGRALELAIESEKYFGKNPYDIIFNNNFKADIYRLLGQDKKGLELVEQNIQTEEINYYSTENLKCLQLLYELNFNLGNFEEAFLWNDSLRNMEQILRDEDIRHSIEELEAKYETHKKEAQIELLTTENKLKNQRLRAGIILLTVLVIIIFMILYILRIRKKQALLIQNDLQQQVLRAQMNPHFIFNVLGSIQNFMLQNNTKKAAGFLAQFASLTRATLNNSAAETISLSDEISMLKNYIELEQMRCRNSFNFEIKYDDNLEADFIQIPPMLVQPFVENAIKHGLKNLDRQGFLHLHISDKNESIEFIVEDNGKGIEETKDLQKKYQSMATSIFEKRRKLIQLRYKKDFNFELQNIKEINPENTGVKISINIPILNHD